MAGEAVGGGASSPDRIQPGTLMELKWVVSSQIEAAADGKGFEVMAVTLCVNLKVYHQS